jgi:flagellar biosynthesis/type III secretory pathway protein FliH
MRPPVSQKERGRKERRKEGREGGRDGGREGGRKEGRKQGRKEGRKDEGRVVKHETPQIENNPNAHHWLKKKK